MNNPVNDRPDPLTPEHQLIREAAVLPQLSSNLRSRVMVDCQHQVSVARWKRRLTVAGSLAAVACLALVMMYVPRSQEPASTAEQPAEALPIPETPSYMSPGTQAPVIPDPTGDQGLQKPDRRGAGKIAGNGEGSEPTPEVKQNKLEPRTGDDINLLIDELHRRNRRLCGIFLW